MITVDTFYKPLKVPSFFYQYYDDTFIIKAYTCDKMPADTEGEAVYQGISQVYSCYCNNGDYHSLPDINFELKDLEYQFDLSA